MFKVSRREYDSFLVKDFGRRNRRATGGEKDGLRETRVDQLRQESASVPHLESEPAQIHKVDFDSFLYILGHTVEEGLFALQLIEGSVDQVHAEDAESLLLKEVGSIPQVDMQQYVVGRATGP
jgi:hypothetical protein